MKPKNTKDRETTHEENMEKALRYGIKYIDLKIDFAFKFVFGMHGREDLLLLLIDSILPDKHIVSVTLGPQEQMPDNPDKRRSIYDINCTTESGAHITVEMQCAKQSDFFNQRMISIFAVAPALKVYWTWSPSLVSSLPFTRMRQPSRRFLSVRVWA